MSFQDKQEGVKQFFLPFCPKQAEIIKHLSSEKKCSHWKVVWFKDLLGGLTHRGLSIWVSRFYISNKALIAKVTDHLFKPDNKSALSIGVWVRWLRQSWGGGFAFSYQRVTHSCATRLLFRWTTSREIYRRVHAPQRSQKFYLLHVSFGNSQNKQERF